MKILLLNPHVDAEHQISRALQLSGVGALYPEDATEAWQMLQLHGNSVDLAVIHLERTQGAELIKKLRKDSAQGDLPILITSESWGDAEFSAHQQSPFGANAYLRWPFSGDQLLRMIEAVVGLPETTRTGALPPVIETVPPPFPSALESQIIDAVPPPAPIAQTTDGISLEAPILIETAEATPGPELSSPPAFELELGAPNAEPVDSIEIPIMPIETPEPLQAGPAAEIRLMASLGRRDDQDRDQPGEEAPVEQDRFGGEAVPTPVEGAGFSPAPVELPYLFGRGSSQPATAEAALKLPFAQPLGDAVVPGGAAQSPDVETLKRYLLLREQDVVALSSQLKSARERIGQMDQELAEERAKGAELFHVVEGQRRRLADFEKEKQLSLQGLQGELGELRFQVKAKHDKAKLLEQQVRAAAEETERLKDRVRSDIRKIRVREKELENRLEIMKKDAEALLGARESKIIELKRKLDLLEFNMDLLQDRYSREKEKSEGLKDRLARAAQAMRVVGGLLGAQRAAGLVGEGDPLEPPPESLADALSDALSEIQAAGPQPGDDGDQAAS